jgi:hypothetical protein
MTLSARLYRLFTLMSLSSVCFVSSRQSLQFFRLTVDQKHSESGFILSCRGHRGGKFKLFMFDTEGNLVNQEEGIKTKSSKGKPQTHPLIA